MNPHRYFFILAVMAVISLGANLSAAASRYLGVSGQDQPQAAKKALTNAGIVRMLKAGFDESVILSAIHAGETDFDVSVDALISLKTDGVNQRIIDAMLKARAGKQNGATQPAATSSGSGASVTVPGANNNESGTADPPSVGVDRDGRKIPWPADKGAYFWNGKELVLLYQSPVPSSGSNFWRSVTPFVKQKIELQLIGAYAKPYFDDNQPTIVLSGLGEVIPGVPAFRWLYVKSGGMLKDRRIVGTYDVGGFFGSVQRVDNEIECEIKKAGDGVYTIRPVKPLADGEYGLVPVPKLAEASSNPSFAPPIWDFGIYVEGRRPDKKK